MIPIETQPERRTLPVLMGLAVSGLVHLAAMAGLAMSPGVEAGSVGERKVGVLILPAAERVPEAAAPTPEPKPEAAPEPKPEQEPEAIRAGIEDSNAVSPNWQGFNEREATEHAAAKSSVEQAALALNPGSPAPAVPPEMPRSEPPEAKEITQAAGESTAQHEKREEPGVAGEPPAPQEREEDKVEATKTLQSPPVSPPSAAQPPEARPAPAPVGEPPSPVTPVAPELEAGEMVDASPDAARDAMVEVAIEEPAAPSDTDYDAEVEVAERVDAPPAPDLKALWALFATPPNATSPLSPPPPVMPPANSPPAPPVSSTPPSANEPPASAQPGGNPGQVGLASDAESDASSIKEAIEYRLGKPLAGKGLKIRTLRPNWSVTTRLTASPRNPVVRVVFGRDGRVLEAKFVAGQETGYPDVDAPILHAVYRWTASGEALTKLPAGDPRAGVTMTFRMILRE